MRGFLINRPKDQRINNCIETTTLMDSAVPSRWREKGGIEETGQERTKAGQDGTKTGQRGQKTGRNGTEPGLCGTSCNAALAVAAVGKVAIKTGSANRKWFYDNNLAQFIEKKAAG